MKVNRVLVVSEFVLSDDNSNKVRIKHMDGRWHFIIDDESVFSFKEEEASDFVSLFQEIGKFDEINRSRSVKDIKEHAEEIKYAVGECTKEYCENTEHLGPCPNIKEIRRDESYITSIRHYSNKLNIEDRILGEIVLWPHWMVPKHFMYCDGSELEVKYFTALYSVLRKDDQFKANVGGKTFNLPNLPRVGKYSYIICVE